MKNSLKKLLSMTVLVAGLFFSSVSLNAIVCSDACGSITCPGATSFGIAVDLENNKTTYCCSTGQESTVNNCTDPVE